MRTKDQLNQLSGTIIDSAMEVHREFGPGLLERVYEAALVKKLALRGISAQRQLPVLVSYKNELIQEEAYRIDLLVEESILVELKTVSEILPIHEAQLHTYMKLSKISLGLLINFNVILLRDGVRRRVINFPG
ncbi:MAG: GxxExxY protein [Verrucomicrobiaceae bacterium]|nr:MAG: GxxExxY protein [Verrucomicrobiaceae bacterium]